MDIALNAHVECTDGRVGRVENIIFNPVTKRVTHLVVRGNDLENTMRLVPERQVKDATPEVIFLSFDKKKFDPFGGYMMDWFQAKTKRFKCLASMMSIFDLESMWGETEELWFVNWDLRKDTRGIPMIIKNIHHPIL